MTYMYVGIRDVLRVDVQCSELVDPLFFKSFHSFSFLFFLFSFPFSILNNLLNSCFVFPSKD
jgi:hypothetical protein